MQRDQNTPALGILLPGAGRVAARGAVSESRAVGESAAAGPVVKCACEQAAGSLSIAVRIHPRYTDGRVKQEVEPRNESAFGKSNAFSRAVFYCGYQRVSFEPAGRIAPLPAMDERGRSICFRIFAMILHRSSGGTRPLEIRWRYCCFTRGYTPCCGTGSATFSTGTTGFSWRGCSPSGGAR